MAAAIVAIAAAATAEVNVRADLDLADLAECVADSGALYYGASWCPVCKRQNAYFGEHADSLPYVECYDGPKSDGKNQTCEEEDIQGFPTWVFADGRTRGGALTPTQLAGATGCWGL